MECQDVLQGKVLRQQYSKTCFNKRGSLGGNQHRLNQTIAISLDVENNPALIENDPTLTENDTELTENNPAKATENNPTLIGNNTAQAIENNLTLLKR